MNRMVYNKIGISLIALLVLFLLGGSGSAAYPPPAILKIDGYEQTSGVGNNCWKEENQTSYLCSDTIGFITPTEPLVTGSPFTAHLHFTLQEPLEEAGLSATRVMDDDELKVAAHGTRAWRLTPEHIQQLQANDSKRYKLPSERESEINLSLPPGLYVLNLDATWKDKGEGIYSFLVQVMPEGISVNEMPNISKVTPAGTTPVAARTERAAGFQVVISITIILAAYIAGRKMK